MLAPIDSHQAICVWLDMCINTKTMLYANWKSLRYKFKCFVDYAKWAFYRAANATFGKVNSKVTRADSEEVALQLITSKWHPVFLYGFDACRHKTHTGKLDASLLQKMNLLISPPNAFSWNLLIGLLLTEKQSLTVRLSSVLTIQVFVSQNSFVTTFKVK
jgi:hypothetical protein